MRYLGGKARLGGRIVQAILADLGVKRIGLAADICAGAGGVTHRLADVANCVVAVEYHAGLVALMRAVQGGWVPPEHIDEDEYARLRHADPSDPLTAFAGFGCSFAGKLWGGYARAQKPGADTLRVDNYARESSRSLRKCMRSNVVHVQADATTWEPPIGLEVAYIDPPYEGTTGYSGAPAQPPGTWWRRAQGLADVGVAVYVSEYVGPPSGIDAREVWTATAHGTQLTKGTKIERLWRVLPSLLVLDATLERDSDWAPRCRNSPATPSEHSPADGAAPEVPSARTPHLCDRHPPTRAGDEPWRPHQADMTLVVPRP